MLPAMSQGKTSQNISLNNNRLADSAVDNRERNLAIAANPNTCPDRLRHLAKSGDRLIRKTVVSNPNTPREILFELGAEFPESLINNPVWDLLFLEDPRLLRDLPLIVQQHLLYQENVPSYLMELIAAGGDFNLRLGLTRHPKTPYLILQKLFKFPEHSLQKAVKLHIKWPEPVQEFFEEIINATLEQQSTKNSTKFTLRSLVEHGLLFDLMGMGNQGNNQQIINEVSHPSLWIGGLQNLRIKIKKNEETFKYDGLNKHQVLEKVFAELSQDFNPTIKKYFTQDSNPSPAIFPDLFSLETSNENPLPPRHKISTLASQAPRRSNVISHLLESIACFFYTPHWLLSLLANGNLSLRRKVLTHPNLPSYILEKLALDPHLLVQRDVAKHPNTPPSGLEILAWVPNSEVRSYVAKHLNTGVFELLALATDTVVKVRWEIAKNPRTPTLALELLALDNDIRVRVEVAKHPNIPPEYSEPLLKDYKFYEKSKNYKFYDKNFAVVNESSEIIEDLKDIMIEKSYEVKSQLFADFEIPFSFLEKLATDPKNRVRQGVVKYRYLPSSLVRQLTQDNDLEIRCSAINHPNLSVSMLKELLCDRNLYNNDDKTYQRVASNYLKHQPKSLPLVLKKIAEYSTDSFERLVVLLHPQILPSALVKNRLSLEWIERYCIAQHPNTPLYTLEELANDGNRIVRAVAWNNLIQRQKLTPYRRHPDDATGDKSG